MKKKRLPVPQSNISHEDLLRLFKEMQRPLRLDPLLRALHLPRRLKKELESQLQQLATEGKVIRLPGGAWSLTGSLQSLRGTYTVTRNGTAFVTPIPNEKGKGKGSGITQDIFIPAFHNEDAWPGDTVHVLLLPGRRGKNPEGKIVHIEERGQKELPVHVVSCHESGIFCRSADARIAAHFELPPNALATPPKKGDLLLIQPQERLASDLWRAKLVSSFGSEEDIAVQEQLVKLNHRVPQEFPPAVLAEVSTFPTDPAPEDMDERKDVRHIPFVTIDGSDARDFDDAIHVEKTAHGWLLRVAIADVTHYVRPRSALDQEAFERANSWYFPASVEPMLPEALSNGLCSLKPHVDRLVMLAEIPFSHKGIPGKASFASAVLRSAARLTYNQVKYLFQEDAVEEHKAFAENPQHVEILDMLHTAQELAQTLTQVRNARGSLDFELPEAEYHWDTHGHIQEIVHRERHFAHRLIEECMIAANEAVARFLEEKGEPFLFRVHPQPEADRLESLFRTLKSLAFLPKMPASPSANILQHILRDAHGTPQEYLIGRLILRTMPQARYQPDNEGHFGLGSTSYCHFTSPIRRYADIIVHRALKSALGLHKGNGLAHHKLIRTGDQLNRRERAAMEAEREIARRLACLLLSQRVGESFSGTICSVNDFGLFVELEAMPVEGFIRVADLGDDYFEYDPERQELIGIRTGRRYHLGQHLQVRLMEVHSGRLEIRFALSGVRPVSSNRRKAMPPRNKKEKEGKKTNKKITRKSGKKKSLSA